MARKAVTVTKLAENAATADPAGTAIDAAEGNVVEGTPLEELVLEVKVTNAEGGDVTVKAGDSPPALEAGQGDLTVAFEQNDIKLIGPFTSGRFIQSGADAGDLHIDFGEGVEGTVKAIHLPREA